MVKEKMDNDIQPVIVHEEERSREGQDNLHFGDVSWKTLLSADTTPSLYMTCGIVEVGSWNGGKLATHRHPQSEVYHVLEGRGAVTIEGKEYWIRKGSTLFIPGNFRHGTRNEGESPLRIFYVFAVDSFKEIEYWLPQD